MGLCKCSKRKVTNLFCFEHRVNVCESCLVSSHNSCVVQTYLSWLTDSDYDSNCVLCTEPLSSKETVRLKCFHVFHWSCLNFRASQLPNTTAPAGYKCPSCLDIIFPSANQTSPVIDQLREKLSQVPWAKTGLNYDGYYVYNNSSVSGRSTPSVHLTMPDTNGEIKTAERVDYSAVNMENRSTDIFEANTFTARSKPSENSNVYNSSDNVGGKNFSSTSKLLENDDSADAKYAKRALERSLKFRCSRLPRSLARIGITVFVLFIIYYMFHSRSSTSNNSYTDEDLMFDPHANPNIRIE